MPDAERQIDFATACGLLADQAVLVSANNRLARHLAGRFADSRMAKGEILWETPDILPLGAWLGRCYQRLMDSGLARTRLLTSHQQRLLWERQVNHSAVGAELLRPDTAAALAAEAWERLCAWNLTLDDLASAASEECRAFSGWARGFQADCATNRWLDAGRLPSVLKEAVRRGDLAPPAVLILAGFEEHAPALASLIAAIEDAGSRVCELTADTFDSRPARIGLQDSEAELHAAASWAVKRLRERPKAKLAVLIPDLAQRRMAVVRQLEALLHPECAPRLQPPASQRLYNLSLGRPLTDYPLAMDALMALRLLISGLDSADVSTLLRSPFLGAAESEYFARCRLDARLRERPDQRISARWLTRLAADGCPVLARSLQQAAKALDGGPAAPGLWSARLRSALAALGWPGERGLDSDEHQQAERLRDLVDELPGLDPVEPRMDARRMLACLDDLARHTTFQAESPGTARIQVMGLLEAEGQSFDGLWITGLSDQQLPPAARPHPLLPAGLQRRHAMPHASPERELAFSHRLLHGLLRAAPEVIVSWPRRDEDRDLLPTPLIGELPEQDFAALDIPGLQRLDETWLGHSRLSETADHYGTPVAADDAVSGGTRLLLDQAACPFRAYAHHRLHASAINDPEPGPSPLLRGNLIHAALEAFWRAVGDSQTLHGFNENELGQQIDEAVETALTEAGRDLSGKSRELEHSRLTRRLGAWLEIEKQRAPFTVAATEERRELLLNGLRLHTQADRVDRLADGRLVVIDYKSGNARRDGWLEGRLFEPQLPLYAVTTEQAPVAAVCFAKLKAGDTRFLGTAEERDLLPGVKALSSERRDEAIVDWPALLQHWRQGLDLLSAEVREGLAVVAPQKADACSWCDLGDLCRVPLSSEDQTATPTGTDSDE